MMEDFLFPVAVEGDWRPEHAKSVKNILQTYFQSKNSHGGDCIVTNHNQNAATILFKSSETRDNVLTKVEHIITFEDYTVTLKVRKLEDSTTQSMNQACAFQEPATFVFCPPSANQPGLENENTPKNVPVKKDSYFKLLNENLFKSMRIKMNLPKPVTVNIHPAIREFLLKKGLISSIDNKMSLFFCQINMDKPEVLLSPYPALLKQKCGTKRHIDGWAKNASDAFEVIMSNYKTFELQVLLPVWTKAESDVKKLAKDQVFINMDASKGVLTLAGATHDIIFLKPVLEKILVEASTQIERERNCVTENMEMTPVMYSLLIQDGLETVSTRLKLDYSKNMNKLKLSGLLVEILTVKNWVLEKKLYMIEKPLKLGRSLQEFLGSGDCNEISKNLIISHGISAVYTVKDKDVILMASTEKAFAEAEKRLKTCLTYNDLTVKDQNILAMPQWQTFISDLQNTFNTPHTKVLINFSKERNEVRVSGFRESVTKISEPLRDFIEKHTRIEDALCVKSFAVTEFIKDRKRHDWKHLIKSDEVTVCFDSERPIIKLSGERRFVQPAMSFFKKMADDLYTETLIIKQPGAKKYFKEEGQLMLLLFMRDNRYTVVLQEDHLHEEDDEHSHVPLGKISRVQVGEVTVEVSSGDITKEKTDAIVSSSNQTFSLKAGVSKAILDAAGLQVENELLQIARDTDYKLTEIVTPVRSGNLPCKDIIHIVGHNKPDKIKDAVFSVLKICEAHRFTSVAFPALGTGQGEVNPADVADAMIGAVIDFVKKEKPVHVKSVKFLLFQKSIEADFHQRIPKRASEKEEKKGILNRIKGVFESPSNKELAIVVEEIDPVVFHICGETPQDLSKASHMINLLTTQKHKDVTIQDPAIHHFTTKELAMLNAIETELKVSIKLENSDGGPVIILKGLKEIVQTAESRIQGIIRRVERNEHQKREAALTSIIVEWQYEDKKNEFKTVDISTNYDMEEAFKLQKTSVTVKIDNTEYDADLVNKVARKGTRQIKLKRIDLRAQISSPLHWEDMKGQLVVLVKLIASSQEYADVEKEFRRTGLTSNVIQIDRVQNSTLWCNYTIQKRHLEKKNKHNNNEKLLFHGTGPENTDQINHHGFNRSFAGIHGALYGNGTYFAVDPKYSAQGYSPSDGEGHKRMYLVRVLVGEFTQGKNGLRAPPKKRSNAIELYDSVTDNLRNPSMFVIFHDVQAYPEYIITFQESN